ncbi:hypothetical protein KY343_00780 [Candidatus Woesearchaeota archaeon]|nr:hypothetical protein [Candidatus Woesearchaeota archaeon]
MKQCRNILGIIILISSIRYIVYLIKYGIPYISWNLDILIHYLSELGGLLSFGIFNIILAAIGFYIIWNNKKQILGYTFLFAVVLFSFYFNSLNIYLNFIFAIAAGYSLVSIVKMRYSLSIIKKLTIILLLCGLIFSTVSYTARVSNFPPDKSFVDSLEWLRGHSKSEEVMFSYHTKGNLIQSIANRPVLLDSNLMYIEDVKTKLDDSNIIFYSRTLKKTTALLDKYNISYIWIDSEMKKRLIWTEEDEGLLFLFSNKEEFKKVYDREGIEIWQVKG